MLTKIVGLSTREASAQLKISEGALKVRVHRAINGLQKMLAVDSL
jgi:DNA-directed RNA polymerase specialized sigma24 family protein